MSAKITPLSGFPEWLPEQRIIEQHFLDVIRSQNTNGPITEASLAAVAKFLAYGLIDASRYTFCCFFFLKIEETAF